MGGLMPLESNKLRMAAWAALAIVLIMISFIFHAFELAPHVAALTWKYGVLCGALFVIYWAGRDKLGRLDHENAVDPIALGIEKIAHAIFFGLGLIAFALVSQ